MTSHLLHFWSWVSMGQILTKVQDLEREIAKRRGVHYTPKDSSRLLPKSAPDLHHLPPELAVLVLSNLNATDLCLAACVWQDLAHDDILWHGLCRSQWKFASVYNRRLVPGLTYRMLYLKLDEATLTFNADADLGLKYLLDNHLVEDSAIEIAKFLYGARDIDRKERRRFLKGRQDVLDHVMELQNFRNQFLPNALRQFFRETNPPDARSDYLSLLVEKFSDRFCDCNPDLGLSKDTVYVVCFSLIMLSVDLSSPHIKNKMSKREFIRNTRQATHGLNEDLAGHLYDNIYLIGHIAPQA